MKKRRISLPGCALAALTLFMAVGARGEIRAQNDPPRRNAPCLRAFSWEILTDRRFLFKIQLYRCAFRFRGMPPPKAAETAESGTDADLEYALLQKGSDSLCNGSGKK